MAISERLSIAIKQIESARAYTKTMLADLTPEDWYFVPDPPVSHIAWQVGHLAMAEYGLCLFRQRGRQEVDSELMSGKFRKLFMKGTMPSDDSGDYPQPEEILTVLDRVHEQALLEMPAFDGAGLDEPLEMPYFGFPTRYGSLLFAGHHEMLHCGQIGMLRRLIGKPPVR